MTQSPPDPPLEIAFLDSWIRDPARGSGSAVAISGLRRGLEARGHSVSVFRPRRRAAGLGRRLLYNLRLPLRFDAPSFDLAVGFDFDGLLLPRDPRTPFVASLKGIAADEQRFEEGPARIRLLAQARLEAVNVSRADAVVVPSRYSRHWARRAYGAAPKRTAVVPEGLDLGRWGLGSTPRPAASTGSGPRPDPDGTDLPRPLVGDGPGNADDVTVLSVARQYRRKNTTDLIAAVARLVRDGRPVRLRVVGGGPELDRLRALAVHEGLGRRVRFLGELSRGEVRAEYRAADLFCLPSLQEGFGIAFLEAMAAGLPVVACRAGAAPEVVKDGETGLLCPPGSVAALAHSLQRLLTRPALRRRMGRRGRIRASRYGWKAVAGRFLRACRRLVRTSNRRGRSPARHGGSYRARLVRGPPSARS